MVYGLNDAWWCAMCLCNGSLRAECGCAARSRRHPACPLDQLEPTPSVLSGPTGGQEGYQRDMHSQETWEVKAARRQQGAPPDLALPSCTRGASPRRPGPGGFEQSIDAGGAAATGTTDQGGGRARRCDAGRHRVGGRWADAVGVGRCRALLGGLRAAASAPCALGAARAAGRPRRRHGLEAQAQRQVAAVRRSRLAPQALGGRRESKAGASARGCMNEDAPSPHVGGESNRSGARAPLTPLPVPPQ
jgi:hypothetical protein